MSVCSWTFQVIISGFQSPAKVRCVFSYEPVDESSQVRFVNVAPHPVRSSLKAPHVEPWFPRLSACLKDSCCPSPAPPGCFVPGSFISRLITETSHSRAIRRPRSPSPADAPQECQQDVSPLSCLSQGSGGTLPRNPSCNQ